MAKDPLLCLRAVETDRRGSEFYGATIAGGREAIPSLQKAGIHHAIVAIGLNEARCEAAEVLDAAGFSLIRAIDPTAVLAGDAVIGEGTVVMPGCVVNPCAVVESQVVLNTAATVDHHCSIEDGAFLAPGVHLGGHVRIGRRAFLGIGCVVADRVSIGEDAQVGAGAVVLEDVPDRTLVAGVPARPIRSLDR